jgi:hypothetical protein
MSKILIDRHVLKQILKTIESWNPTLRTDDDAAAITSLRDALEQQDEQEPVAKYSDIVRQALRALRAARVSALHPDSVSLYAAAITRAETALTQPEQEPVAWSTRERFYEALDRAVGNVRQEMRIKTVTMHRKDHDIALPIIDAYSGHVLVGDPPLREWRGLSEEEIKNAVLGDLFGGSALMSMMRDGVMVAELRQAIERIARAIEAKLKEKNT